jgi:branched-subunit amino acid transport protein AzlD
MSLTVAANDDGAIVEPQAPTNLISFLARAVHDPSVDVHKLEAIYRIITDERREQRAILAGEARVRATDAMNKVSAELKVILRNRVNDHTRSKYADLQAVDEVIRPIYTKHGFSISFDAVKHDGEMWVRAILRHVTPGASMDHVETFEMPAPPDIIGAKGSPNKTEIQGICAATTYMRRYLKFMIFDAATGDDNDGNRAKPANDTGEVLGREAIELLVGLIAETKTDERKLLAHMGFPDLTTIKDVPAREFAKFKNALLSKKNTLVQRAARAAQQGAAA